MVYPQHFRWLRENTFFDSACLQKLQAYEMDTYSNTKPVQNQLVSVTTKIRTKNKPA